MQFYNRNGYPDQGHSDFRNQAGDYIYIIQTGQSKTDKITALFMIGFHCLYKGIIHFPDWFIPTWSEQIRGLLRRSERSRLVLVSLMTFIYLVNPL